MVRPSTKDAFELYCLRVDNEYWLNANDAQMDVGTALVDGNLHLAVALLLLNHCLMCCSHCLWGLCVLSLFCNALLTCSILSSFAIILTGKRKLVALL